MDLTIYDDNLNGDRHFLVLRTTWTREEMKSMIKINFNTDAKIILAVLKRFRCHKTKFQVSNTVVNGPWLFLILKYTSPFNHRRRWGCHRRSLGPYWGEHGWRMRLGRCLSPLSTKLSLVGRVYSWMGDNQHGYNPVLVLELGTYASRVL